MSKPKVLVCVLCGTERQNWIYPELSGMLIRMSHDSRFDVAIGNIKDGRPVEVPRNESIALARDNNFDWLVSFDNDNFMPSGTPLDIISLAGPSQNVIGLGYVCGSVEAGYKMFPPPTSQPINGPFREVDCLNGGALMVHRSVWQAIPRGPWFRFMYDEGVETLRAKTSDWAYGLGENGGCSEDFYFVRLCRKHELKCWTHTDKYAGHYRTTDLTGMVCTIEQARGAAR